MKLQLLTSYVRVLASRVIIRNLVFLAAIGVAMCFMMTTKTSAFIIAVLHTGFSTTGCRRVALDSWAECHVVAFCESTDTNTLIGIDAGAGYFCANFFPTVGNSASTDGIQGGNQISGNTTSITVPGFSMRHLFQGWANCTGTPPLPVHIDNPQACTIYSPRLRFHPTSVSTLVITFSQAMRVVMHRSRPARVSAKLTCSFGIRSATTAQTRLRLRAN